MKAKFFIVPMLILLTACGSSKQPAKKGWGTYGSPNVEQKLLNNETFVVEVYSDDITYGYTEENPIMVGAAGGSGPLNERRFLNALMGPDGEPITYRRIGSCCGFKTKNGLFDDGGFLDKYSVMHKGLEKEVILYINMYDSDVLKIPVGFKKKK
ncbi:MAG: hypothetical protein LBS20_04490 [Prevotella sp.]|jgi:hypothetical protein|uniref:hypothetical protein n=1 Tax=unclassified Dysgonomonas TaxID=2630389 RepID=UPI0025BA37F9|nr:MULTISPECIES: hypothetical protein [unclassified Dysgonomonas]MDR1715081.1 hypothetical protein [Prevotella sp.]MDR2004203.1 hypothetical protein [Prevotella sp.]HMM04933.1 hypothetical protein [Dysgonomonas sp.]